MSPKPSSLQQVLRALVLRLVLLLDGFLGRRAAFLRARLHARPAHRHHRAMTRELARLERVRTTLADPHLFDDPRMIGCAAEVARVRNDAGRRARVRRILWGTPPRPIPAAIPAPRATLEAPEERCTTIAA